MKYYSQTFESHIDHYACEHAFMHWWCGIFNVNYFVDIFIPNSTNNQFQIHSICVCVCASKSKTKWTTNIWDVKYFIRDIFHSKQTIHITCSTFFCLFGKCTKYFEEIHKNCIQEMNLIEQLLLYLEWFHVAVNSTSINRKTFFFLSCASNTTY